MNRGNHEDQSQNQLLLLLKFSKKSRVVVLAASCFWLLVVVFRSFGWLVGCFFVFNVFVGCRKPVVVKAREDMKTIGLMGQFTGHVAASISNDLLVLNHCFSGDLFFGLPKGAL